MEYSKKCKNMVKEKKLSANEQVEKLSKISNYLYHNFRGIEKLRVLGFLRNVEVTLSGFETELMVEELEDKIEKRLERLEGDKSPMYNLIINNQKMISNIMDGFEKREKQLVKEFKILGNKIK